MIRILSFVRGCTYWYKVKYIISIKIISIVNWKTLSATRCLHFICLNVSIIGVTSGGKYVVL